MLENIAIGIGISVLISAASSNLIQPEYSVKILNTENIILSLGDIDVDNNDDLEMIQDAPENPKLDKKLNKFHKFVKIVEVSERPLEKFFYQGNKFVMPMSNSEMWYPDSPIEIAANRKHLSMLERRSKKRKLWLKFKRRMKALERRKKLIGAGGYKKRELTNEKKKEDSEEYRDLEKEYLDMVEESLKNHTAYKYSDEGKPEENFKEVIQKITDLKVPKNCTNVTGIGVQAVECLMKNFKNKEIDKREMFNKVSLILLVWFCVYLIIVVPLWCTQGWCCCCFRCSFCQPTKTVREIQKYIAQNPPGIYVNSNGEEEHYNPTVMETELYEKLKRAISDF